MNFCDTARLCLFPRFVISFFFNLQKKENSEEKNSRVYSRLLGRALKLQLPLDY